MCQEVWYNVKPRRVFLFCYCDFEQVKWKNINAKLGKVKILPMNSKACTSLISHSGQLTTQSIEMATCKCKLVVKRKFTIAREIFLPLVLFLVSFFIFLLLLLVHLLLLNCVLKKTVNINIKPRDGRCLKLQVAPDVFQLTTGRVNVK